MKTVGEKIKQGALVIACIEGIGALIGGMLLFDDYLLSGYAIVVIIAGMLGAVVTGILLYALGQLVEDVHDIRNQYIKNENGGNFENLPKL